MYHRFHEETMEDEEPADEPAAEDEEDEAPYLLMRTEDLRETLMRCEREAREALLR